MGLSFVAAVLALAPLGRAMMGTLAAAAVIVFVLIQGAHEIPWLSLAYGLRSITTVDPGQALYVGGG